MISEINADGEQGRPLPEDHLSFQPEAMYPSRVFDQAQNRMYQSHSDQAGQIVGGGFHRDDYARSRGSSPGRMNGGPGYADLPSHGEDVKKLGDECNAAREAARVLSEALVFTRPDELDSKPIIQVSCTVVLLHWSLMPGAGVLPHLCPGVRVFVQPDGLGAGRGRAITRAHAHEWFAYRHTSQIGRLSSVAR